MVNNQKLQEIKSKLAQLDKEKTLAEGRITELVSQRDAQLEVLKNTFGINTPKDLIDASNNLDRDINNLEQEINQLISTLPDEIQERINGGNQPSSNY